MMQVFKTILSMSLSGAALISLLLLGRRFWKGKPGRQWQYYIWMIVVLRLLLPFGPEVSLLGKVYQDADRAVVKMMQEERQVGSDNGQSPKQSSEKDTVQRIGQYSEQSAAQEPAVFRAERRRVWHGKRRKGGSHGEISLGSLAGSGLWYADTKNKHVPELHQIREVRGSSGQ